MTRSDRRADAIGRMRPYDFFKRIFDIAFSLIVLAAASPFCLLVAIAIKMTSRGPVFYRQTAAIGRGGRPFTLFKFRTMAVGASDASHKEAIARFVAGESLATEETAEGTRPVFKIVRDPRVTAIGRILRKSGLDEIPQFYNVLRGDMSVVGPRPPVKYEYERYDEQQRGRLAVRPGITGLYQVSARSLVSFDRMVEIDLDYIARRSLVLDLSIICRTPVVMLTGRGAY
jgi:lipopolysaccharide/colanic/teichoic acid biosynthesis glycosyltransferase